MAGSGMDLQQAEGWRPDDGAVLIGTVRNVDASWSDYIGGYYPLIVIEPEDGSKAVAVHCFHDVLRKRVLMLKPKRGERIGIKYHGQTKTKDGKRTVSNYTVKIDGRDSDADVWGAMSNPATEPRGMHGALPSERLRAQSAQAPLTDADYTRPLSDEDRNDDEDEIPF